MRASVLPLPGGGTWRIGAPYGEGTWRPGQALRRFARHPWLARASALLAVACACAAAEGPTWRQETVLASVNLALALAFAVTGLMLAKDPGQRVVATALTLAGVFRCVDFIDAWNGPWPAYGLVFGGVDRLFGAWALLRYPSSCLSRLQRRYLLALTCWVLGGRTLIAVTSTARWNGGPPSWWWPALAPDQGLSDALNVVVHGGEGLFCAGLVVLLAMRLARARGLDRVIVTPITVAGIAAVIATGVSAATMMLSLSATPNAAYLTESVADFAIPVAFVIAVVQQLLLTRNVTELTAQACLNGDIGALRHALRDTLHDPTLELLDASAPGLPELDARSAGRLVTYVGPGQGAPVAVVVADPGLARYRWLLDAAVRASGLALRSAQLQARVAQDRLEQVRASRARVIEAELAERRRLERDLHDGVQQHLLSITARLSAAMTVTTDPEAAAAISQARDGLTAVLADLRDLAHGIHPAALARGGLAVALQDVAERLPLPVRVTVPARRLGTAVEATLYFVACEALANAVKHARAGSAAVTVRATGPRLEMEVADDGAGGVTAGRHGGGLANIAGRVSALDGDVTIDSPPGRGTRVIVSIPCG